MNSPLVKKRIFVAGHAGLVGSAICRALHSRGCTQVITNPKKALNLLDQKAVDTFIEQTRPDLIIDAAARVGGILANNTRRADFIYENLQIQNNLIWSAHRHDVRNFIFLGSSCIYPKQAPQPMPEDCLLTGPLEYTNRPYAIAKIAGMELVNALREQYGREYLSVMPTNLYGPGDNFDLQSSHVIPALMHKMHIARSSQARDVKIWGSGGAKREFLYSDDLAEAVVFIAEKAGTEFFSSVSRTENRFYHINAGSGEEVSIRDLAELVAETVGFSGQLVFDTGMPEGTPAKYLDITRISAMGWKPSTTLKKGLSLTYQWFLQSNWAKS